jgi:hypothetical protein
MKDVEEPSACSKQLCVNQRGATRATSLLNKDARNWITAVPGLLDFATPLFTAESQKTALKPRLSSLSI